MLIDAPSSPGRRRPAAASLVGRRAVVPPAVQVRILTLTRAEAGPQVLALSSSAVYLGASLGAGP
jgi:hypothetical protein